MENAEQRKFRRYPIGIRALVQLGSDAAQAYQEAVWLRDLSGEGALFDTAVPVRYTPGQSVSLTICMPGAPGVHAIMLTSGIVCRVESGVLAADLPANAARVALHFNRPLQFQRSPDGRQMGACMENFEQG